MAHKKNDAPGQTRTERTREEVWSAPDVDIYEMDDGIVLLADMPGVGSDDVEVTVEEGELIIEGRPQPTRIKGSRAVHTEFGPNLFRRVFTLSSDVDASRVEGSISDGVLMVKLPKAEEAKVKRIEIKSE